MTLTAMKQDQQTAKPAGETLVTLPHGMKIREIATITDDRGTLFEMYDPRWGFHEAPLVYAYSVTIRPGIIKGWALHKQHEDRYFLQFGEMELVLYDARPDSPTFGLVSKVYFSERRRMLANIPAGVWHADRNIGLTDCLLVNFPTAPYDHNNPDKYRLPLDTDLIPHKFDNPRGY